MDEVDFGFRALNAITKIQNDSSFLVNYFSECVVDVTGVTFLMMKGIQGSFDVDNLSVFSVMALVASYAE